ncbi:glycosyl hydrolase [Pandoraea terrae]|uniref:Glycosyl hydrolase n=1 Tax=Pandoraea terrae TaxID=1537710 RepID=A0A5E4RQN5_9BURK|nr:YCF48-related protein [Pandoraea terrae]VVD65333.1 glycosyl hydrolase [Pandoraea terrae]
MQRYLANRLSPLLGTFLALGLMTSASAQHAPSTAPAAAPAAHLGPKPAERSAYAANAMMLDAATTAGRRIVAVGDHGVVLLSDDNGVHFRQARTVPVQTALTAVAFADAQHGWAVGHWGVILRTDDGGDTWRLQRMDTAIDQPLFSVHFKDEHKGWATGLWSMLLTTDDGGQHWRKVDIPAPPAGGRPDRNMFKIFADAKGNLFIAAEQGTVFRSQDDGQTWQYVATGYKGTLWSGVALADGTLVVGGLRGTLYRSNDDGASWQAVASPAHSSITSLVAAPAAITGVGLDGTVVTSTDGGRTFSASQRPDRLTLTAAAVAPNGHVVQFSETGVIGVKTK